MTQAAFFFKRAPISLELVLPRGTARSFVYLSVMVLVALISGASELLLLAGLAYCTAIFADPKIGLFGLIAVAGLDSTSYDPITRGFAVLYQAIPGLTVTPVELLVLVTLLGWCRQSAGEGQWRFPNRSLLLSMVFLYVVLLAALVQGAIQGGDLVIGLWEVRGMLLALPIMLLTFGLVRTRREVYEIAAVTVLAMVVMSVELGWRYLSIVRPGDYQGPLETAFSHDGAVLIAFAVIACLAWAVWGPNRKQRLMALALGVVIAIVLLASRRRAALVAGEVGFAFLCLTLLLTDRRRFVVVASISVLVFGSYLLAFWNSSNTLGQPARAFQTVFMSDSLSARDQESDQYRDIENFDSWSNIKDSPLTGLGFGRPYAKPIPIADLSSFWPFWAYVPHNTILWLWMKAGILGFLAFWLVMATGLSQATRIVRTTKDPVTMAIVACVSASFVMLAMFAYVDLGLASARLLILFGVGLGIVGVLYRTEVEEGYVEPAEPLALADQAVEPLARVRRAAPRF